MSLLITSLYVVLSFLVTLFAVRELRLLFRYLRYRDEIEARQLELGSRPAAQARAHVPRVTVQIPVYNERAVALRAVRAAAALDYPREALEIQVLDDSTDGTSDALGAAIAGYAEAGLPIEHLRRTHRSGFKAGALAEGLTRARGEYVAIFDADFVPPANFLKRLLLELGVFEDHRVGYVQARWDYTERDRSRFSRVQGVLLDRHFYVEKPARDHLRCVMFFNGSAGVWRRAAIDDAGGWSSDTLTEDLDLSFRASFRGWRGLYVRDLAAPSDLPDDMLAFKLQQRRWARGSAQCVRKLAAPILRAELPLRRRVHELLTVSGFAIHPIMLASALIWPWAVLFAQPHEVFLAAQATGSFGLVIAPLGFYLAARARGVQLTRSFFEDFALATAIGLGFMVSNTFAFVSGILSSESGEFQRTPKRVPLTAAGAEAAPQADHAPLHWTLYAEVLVAAYSFASAALLYRAGQWMWLGPSLLWGVCISVMIYYQLAALGDARRGRLPRVATEL